jgi:hypothetical protein
MNNLRNILYYHLTTMTKRSGNPAAARQIVLDADDHCFADEIGEEALSEANIFNHCIHSTGPLFSDRKDNNRTVPKAKEKATGARQKKRASGKSKVKGLLYRCEDAALACGVTCRTWRTWNRLGVNPQPVSISRTNFWRIDELEQWVAAGCPHREEWVYRPVMNATKIATKNVAKNVAKNISR